MPQNNTSSSSLLGRLTTSTRSSFMSPKDVRCNVHLLHDSDIIGNEFPRLKSAQTVLDYVCELKHIQEKDFLGLRYQDHNKHRYWLDLSRSIGHVVKQFRTENLTLHLRFRYYPSEPARLRDPNLRYQLFVQLQRDLLHGRLYCPASSAAELAALILQVQLGDYDEQKYPGNYVSEYKLLLKQTPKLEERIAALHKELRGKSSADAELEFLEKASQLDTYAFDPYTIKDPQDASNPVYLGASCKGILIYAGQSRTHHIDWHELIKVDYSGRELKLTLAENYRGAVAVSPTGTLNGSVSQADKTHSKKALTLKYQCPSGQFAKHLWIHILSQQAFFNENSAQDVKLKFSKPRIPLLSRGSTFRFPSKRVYREIEEEDARSMQFDRTILETSIILNETTTSNENEHSDELNTSSLSAPVVRYELPRHSPRVEQPWLAKKPSNGTSEASATDSPSPSTTPDGGDGHNNNLSKITNLNVSFEPTATPSVSQEVPKIVYTPQHAEQNSTSFTVHLVKREATSSAEDVNVRGQTRAQALEHKFNALVQQDVDIGRPLASSTPRAVKPTNGFEKNENGTLANGGGDAKMTVHTTSNGATLTSSEEKQESLVEDDETPSAVSRSVLARIANTCFVAFLVLLLTLAVVICVFEKSDGSTHNDWIENHRALSELRHFYYEPARHFVVDQYRRYFADKNLR